MNGAIIPNHSFILLDNIGESNESLLCMTDLLACCRSEYTGGRWPLGDWFFPNDTAVPNTIIGYLGRYEEMPIVWDFYRNRGPSVVRMHRRRGGVTGIYRCEVPDANGVYQRMYVGLYTGNTGE